MSKVDQLAEVLFVRFQRAFPLKEMMPSGGRGHPGEKEIATRLSRFYEEASEERTRHRLWVVNWARVVMKLQQRLLRAGYPGELVSKLLLAMIFAASHAPDR